MTTTFTNKGQVTIPKQIHDSFNMAPGCSVQFTVNRDGDLVIHKVGARASRKPDRFEAVRCKADVKWRTDDLMALLRSVVLLGTINSRRRTPDESLRPHRPQIYENSLSTRSR